jgi:hypothetical protein
VIQFFCNATDANIEWQYKMLEDGQLITDILAYAPQYLSWETLYNVAQHPGLFGCDNDFVE